MRKILVSLAAAGAALAIASPASAQYYPGQPYGAPYAYGYGFNNYGQVRSLQYRIDRIEQQINRLDRYNRIGDGAADRLRREANRLEDRLHRAARYGLNPYEANDIQVRIARLEQRVQYASAYGGRYGWNGYNGYNGYYGYGDRDRDHDGDRDDRWGDRDDD